MDGFASHLNVREALEIFDQFKILLLKEEGDSSHVNQSYDQLVAKQDKLLTKTYLGMLRTHLKGNIDQYLLVAALCHVLKKVSESDAWKTSFIKVNLHLHHRLPFQHWIKKN